MVKLAREGKRVLRLKGGDPFLFGRGGEEIEALAEHSIPFQVCPGITAASGCAAYSGIPLTHRDHAQACLFVTGHGKDGVTDLDWPALLQPRQTVAVYMGLAHLDTLMAEFIARGADPDLPAAVVDNGTRPEQQVVVGTLGTLADQARQAELRGPAIIIIGTVVTLRDKLGGEIAALPASPPVAVTGHRPGHRQPSYADEMAHSATGASARAAYSSHDRL
jgi:uroporphyrin-III C-methyltransferase/precorrin-2 dehydrogenase/sirohydrochlorin ferrochelatase